MANQGIRPPIDQTPVGGGEAEGAAQCDEGRHADYETDRLKVESGEDTPMRMRPFGRRRTPPKVPPKARSQSSGRWLTTRAGRRTRYAMTIHISSAKKAPPIRECVCQ